MAAVVQDNPDLTRYEVFDDRRAGRLLGVPALRRAIALTHTEVDDRFEGRGLGSALARGVLDEARRDGLAVLPYCPFMAGYIRGHPDDYLELVPDGPAGEVRPLAAASRSDPPGVPEKTGLDIEVWNRCRVSMISSC